MQIIPAVDLVGDDATRLEQGDFGRELFRRPAVQYVTDVASTSPSLIHLVDLYGARSGSSRLDVLRVCVAAAGDIPVQVSGGIRSVETAERVFDLGAFRVLISTAAFRTPEVLEQFVERFGDRVAVSIDVRSGRINVAGWLESTPLTVDVAAQRCVDAGVVRVLGTSIESDGTRDGPDFRLYEELCTFDLAVLAAGGVRDQKDIDKLAAIGCEGAVSGRAFFEGQFRTTQ
jgi:phosphoribosylformimino-5-aminoimidazole carboxamide ribotide isomerase